MTRIKIIVDGKPVDLPRPSGDSFETLRAVAIEALQRVGKVVQAMAAENAKRMAESVTMPKETPRGE